MKIYIASSWRNQHAVEMLTDILRNLGHEVASFVEQAIEAEGRDLKFDVEAWLESDDSNRKFDYDTAGATESDIVIYIGPSGTDAWAEVGAAWAAGVPISGLWAKGEPAGLMRKMVYWFTDYRELLKTIKPVKKKAETIVEKPIFKERTMGVHWLKSNQYLPEDPPESKGDQP